MSMSSPPPTRPISRPSSRNSYRAPSPGLSTPSDDPVTIRNEMSKLKHEIRLRTAQFNALEVQLLRGPRPLNVPPLTPSPTSSTFPLSPLISAPALALRKRSSSAGRHDNIQEGVPHDFAVGSPGSSSKHGRSGSPTRSMSRIPVSAVSQARALAENGLPPSRGAPSPHTNGNTATAGDTLRVSISSAYLDPPSPTGGARRSLGAGNTSKVLAELQAGVATTRAALENTKAQLRGAQRTVATLTRQNEDLKDGRERLRVENEGLNTVVSRKERLLQEVLERARKAESEALNLKAQLKNETTTSKKTLREMEIALAEATALSQKSEREYLTLKDAVKGLQEGWQTDVERLQEEVKRKEEVWKKEIEQVNLKYKSYESERAKTEALKTESKELDAKFGEVMRGELKSLRDAVAKSNADSEEATATARELSAELARLRRLLRAAGRSSSDPSPEDS